MRYSHGKNEIKQKQPTGVEIMSNVSGPRPEGPKLPPQSEKPVEKQGWFGMLGGALAGAAKGAGGLVVSAAQGIGEAVGLVAAEEARPKGEVADIPLSRRESISALVDRPFLAAAERGEGFTEVYADKFNANFLKGELQRQSFDRVLDFMIAEEHFSDAKKAEYLENPMEFLLTHADDVEYLIELEDADLNRDSFSPVKKQSDLHKDWNKVQNAIYDHFDSCLDDAFTDLNGHQPETYAKMRELREKVAPLREKLTQKDADEIYADHMANFNDDLEDNDELTLLSYLKSNLDDTQLVQYIAYLADNKIHVKDADENNLKDFFDKIVVITPEETQLLTAYEDSIYEIRKSYFEGVLSEFYRKDPIYQEAFTTIDDFKQKLISEIEAREGRPLNLEDRKEIVVAFTGKYETDPAFRKQADILQSRKASIMSITGFKVAEKDAVQRSLGAMLLEGLIGEDLARSGRINAQKVADRPGLYVYTPGLLIASAAFGPSAALYGAGKIAVGVFGAHMAKKVAQKAMAEIEKKGYLYDINQAKIDAQRRSEPLQKIFAEAATPQQKSEAIKSLLEFNLLFKEDMVGLEFDKSLLSEEDQTKLDTLPSLKELETKRKPFLEVLQGTVGQEGDLTKQRPEHQLAALNGLHEAGFLYLEDLHSADKGVRQQFLKSIDKTEADIPSIDDSAIKVRNAKLWVLKGADISVEERFTEILGLIGDGLFLQEDIELINRKGQAGHDKSRELHTMLLEHLSQAGNPKISDLPTLNKYYTDEQSLRNKHDTDRAPILKELATAKESKDPEAIVDALKQLHRIGIIFQEDLDGIDNAVLQGFFETTNQSWLGYAQKSDVPTKNDFYNNPKNRAKAVFNSGMAVAKGAAFEAAGAAIAVGSQAVAGAKLAYQVVGAFSWDSMAGTNAEAQKLTSTYTLANGVLQGVKGTVTMSAAAFDDAYGTFFGEPTAIADRVAKQMPSDDYIKRNSQWAVNKGVATMKYATTGALIGSTIGALFGTAIAALIPPLGGGVFARASIPLQMSLTGAAIGGAIAGAFGAYRSDGYVKQIPPGGLIRATLFSAKGALFGAIVSVVGAFAVGTGLYLAGAIALGTAIGIASGGIGFIVPMIFLGISVGWKLAGLTGKDQEVEQVVDDRVRSRLEYKPPAHLEQGFLARPAELLAA